MWTACPWQIKEVAQNQSDYEKKYKGNESNQDNDLYNRDLASEFHLHFEHHTLITTITEVHSWILTTSETLPLGVDALFLIIPIE